MDAVAAIAKAAKTTARNAAAKAPPPGTSLQERKRQRDRRDESVCSCRGYDMEVRFAESHRLNMSVAIDHIRAVLKTRN